MPHRHLRFRSQARTLYLFLSTATPLFCAIPPPVTWCHHLSPGTQIACLPSPVPFSLWQNDRSECKPAGPIPLLIGASLNKRQIPMMWEAPDYFRDGNTPSFLQDSTWKSPFLTLSSKVSPHSYPLTKHLSQFVTISSLNREKSSLHLFHKDKYHICFIHHHFPRFGIMTSIQYVLNSYRIK